jgi:hypothetical protein
VSIPLKFDDRNKRRSLLSILEKSNKTNRPTDAENPNELANGLASQIQPVPRTMMIYLRVHRYERQAYAWLVEAGF